jgi:hypothetical protein
VRRRGARWPTGHISRPVVGPPRCPQRPSLARPCGQQLGSSGSLRAFPEAQEGSLGCPAPRLRMPPGTGARTGRPDDPACTARPPRTTASSPMPPPGSPRPPPPAATGPPAWAAGTPSGGASTAGPVRASGNGPARPFGIPTGRGCSSAPPRPGRTRPPPDHKGGTRRAARPLARRIQPPNPYRRRGARPPREVPRPRGPRGGHHLGFPPEGGQLAEGVLADQAFGEKELAGRIEARGGQACLPSLKNRRGARAYARPWYRGRNRGERFLSRPKPQRRVAARREQAARDFPALVKVASTRGAFVATQPAQATQLLSTRLKGVRRAVQRFDLGWLGSLGYGAAVMPGPRS